MGSTQSSAQPNYLFDQLNTTRSLWGRIFGDLSRAWWVILLCGIGVAALVALLYVQFLKVFTGCMVWTTIFLVVLSLSGMTVWFYYKAGLVTLTVSASLSDKFAAATGVNLNTTVAGVVSKANGLVSQSLSSSDATIDQYKIIAYVSTGVLVIVISIVAAMLRSIAIAIQVIKIGCRALQALPELILFPVTNVLAIGVFLIWWVFVAASLQSAGTVATENDNSMKYLLSCPCFIDITRYHSARDSAGCVSAALGWKHTTETDSQTVRQSRQHAK
jgi:choline transporter-like protein 2/4/5